MSLKDVNGAYPGVLIERKEVSFFHKGFLPMDGINQKTGEVILTKHCRIIDHCLNDGIDGLISVIGVKYTTARDVAEKVIHLIMEKLNKPFKRHLSSEKPLVGGDIPKFNDYLSEYINQYSGRFQPSVIKHLIYNYGSKHSQVIKRIRQDKKLSTLIPGSKEVLKAEVIHAVQEEMAIKLSDVILRRTDLGTIVEPDESILTTCGSLMAAGLGWNHQRIQREIREVKESYQTAD